MDKTVFDGNKLSKEAQELYNSTVSHVPEIIFLNTIDKHNKLTGAHSRGVAQVVSEFAVSDAADFSIEQQRLIVRASALHDLGKLSIDNKILDKDGSLSREDWQQIEYHPIDGFHAYATAFSPEEALPILLHHTFQLRDYPNRKDQEKAISLYELSPSLLDREDILASAAILSVADQFEARYPIADLSNPNISARVYAHRHYSVENLPSLIEASFVEAGKFHKLRLDWLLKKLINLSKDVVDSW